MAGIARGFLLEWIVDDHAVPFLRRADEEMCLKTEALRSLRLQEAFQLGGGSPRRAKNEIAALEQRPDVGEPERVRRSRRSAMATWLWPPTLMPRRRAM